MNQYIGIKIQHLLDAKGLKQKVLAEKMGIGERHISKKIGNEMKFSPSQIAIAADFLGVKESFLRDTSRVFNPGDTIPEDAIATPTPTTTPRPTSRKYCTYLSARRRTSRNQRRNCAIRSLTR